MLNFMLPYFYPSLDMSKRWILILATPETNVWQYSLADQNGFSMLEWKGSKSPSLNEMMNQ